jgi:7-cyano-7-deazaguanine synthase
MAPFTPSVPSSSKKSAVVLLSGGLDSSVNLVLGALEKRVRLALTVDYGQRAARSEIRAARRLCEHFGIDHEVVSLEWLGRLGGSALTDAEKAVPQLLQTRLDDQETTTQSARSVWVPNRNGVLIQVAGAYADRWAIDEILVGFNREEAVTFKDNTPEFIARASRALEFSSSHPVSVGSYTIDLNKTEMVETLLKQFPAFDWSWVWSCYHGGDTPCGKCESCQRLTRARGLA